MSNEIDNALVLAYRHFGVSMDASDKSIPMSTMDNIDNWVKGYRAAKSEQPSPPRLREVVDRKALKEILWDEIKANRRSYEMIQEHIDLLEKEKLRLMAETKIKSDKLQVIEDELLKQLHNALDKM